jgi:peroxiredoxin
MLAGGALAKRPQVGQPAPEFTVKLLSGEQLRLSDLKGQVVLLNFWATWCVPCRTELPDLDAFYRMTKRHGLRVLAITTEGSLPLYQLRKLFAVMAIDPIRAVKGPYSPIDGAVPTSFIIDRAGHLRYAKAGAFTLESLNAEIIPLLNERIAVSPPAP